MIILLNGHSLAAADKFMPESLSVSMSERGSTASMTVGPDAPLLHVDDWLQDETGPAAGIVWRIKTIEEQYDKKTRTVSLEHLIGSLRDVIMFGEIKPEDISGSSADPTARQAAEYILAKQSDWVLGDFAYTKSNPYSFNGDDLFGALEDVTASLADACWEYDFASYPFTIHIRQLDDSLASEMRMNRNIVTLRKTIDKSRMYTRFYPIGKNNLHIDGNYIEKNVGLYGLVSKTETDTSRDTKQKLLSWAQERLDRHCEPAVTVTISGMELAEATGEPLDAFTIGRMCRIPLPEFQTTITERVVKLSYGDIINNPLNVTVTLANELQDVASILRQQSSGSGRAGRYGARQAEEDHAWFEDTTDHVSMVAEAVAGKDQEGNPDWSRVAELTVDGHGIDARVTEAEGEIVTQWSAIEATQSQISLEVGNAVSMMQSSIVQTAEAIRSDVSASNSQIYSYIRQTASNIQTVITDVENNSYSYTNETASGIHRVIVNTTNQTWIQDTDPTTEAGGGHTPKTGDVWVKSTHQGTWDGAEGFDWEHDEQYNWFDIQGAQIYGWANDTWELVSDQQQTISWSEMIDTVELYVNQKIKAVVNDEGMIDVYMSKLQQTAEEIRSEVSTANSTVYSYISQTATNVLIRVGETPRTVVAKTAPTKINNRNLEEGDVWVESQDQDNWDAAAEYSWDDDSQIDWNQLRSNKYHVYHDGKWVEAFDGTTFIDDADLEVEHNTATLYARKLAMVDGELQRYYAELKVGADQIKSQVNEYYNQLGSSITQTAREIRSDVFSDNSKLYSYISQTSTQIRLYVANEISDVSSSITQTASQIRSEVNAANSSIRSSITQTASSIRAEVRNTESKLASSITQTAGQIRSEVAAAESTIHSSITQTASQIKIQVSNAESRMSASIAATASSIRSEVYSTESNIRATITQTANSIRSDVNTANSKIYSYVQQTASSIRQEVGNAISGVNSSITQTASSIRSEVNSAISNVNASITTQANRISLVVEGTGANAKIRPAQIVSAINNGESSIIISASHINLDGYVKATDITTNYISAKIADITLVEVKGLNSNGTIRSINGSVVGTDIYFGSGTGSGFTGWSLKNFIKELQITSSGNTYKLQKKSYSDSDWQDVGTFSRATSLSGAWSGNTYTVTASPQGNTHNVVPVVHPVTSQGNAYMDVYVATGNSSSGYSDHGSATRLYLVTSSGSRTVNLKSANSTTSGTVYAQATVSDTNLSAGNIKKDVTIFGVKGTYNPHPNSLSVRQATGYTGATKTVMYFKDNAGTYHAAAGGSSYAWYYSSTNMNWTSSNHTVYYG